MVHRSAGCPGGFYRELKVAGVSPLNISKNKKALLYNIYTRTTLNIYVHHIRLLFNNIYMAY